MMDGRQQLVSGFVLHQTFLKKRNGTQGNLLSQADVAKHNPEGSAWLNICIALNVGLTLQRVF